MDWITLTEGLVGGGVLVSILTLPSVIKKAKAEAKAAEMDNLHKVIEGWEKLADERQEGNKALEEKIEGNERRIDELNGRIDDLYKINGEWRERFNEQQTEKARLEAKIENDKHKLCLVRNCAKREPKSDY